MISNLLNKKIDYLNLLKAKTLNKIKNKMIEIIKKKNKKKKIKVDSKYHQEILIK